MKLILQINMKVKLNLFLFVFMHVIFINVSFSQTIDNTFNTGIGPGAGISEWVSSIAIQNDGKIIIGGGFTSFSGMVRNGIARLNADGTLDSSFDPGTGFNNPVSTIAIQNDDKILIGGGFFGSGINGIARLNTDGSLDSSFNIGTGFSGYVNSIALQNDGKMIVGGSISSFNGTSIGNIVRLDADGSIDGLFLYTSGSGLIIKYGRLWPRMTAI